MQEGEPLTPELSVWLASVLEAFLTHNVARFEEALGVRAVRGGVPWWREIANRRRDQALRALAERHLPGLTLTACAESITRLATRYGGSGWRFDRDKQEMPDCYRGTPTECLWLAFKSGATMPISARHLRTILSSGRAEAATERSAGGVGEGRKLASIGQPRDTGGLA